MDTCASSAGAAASTWASGTAGFGAGVAVGGGAPGGDVVPGAGGC